MKLTILRAALFAYVLAILVVAVTPPPKRLFWPLYLPVLAAISVLLIIRRHR